MNQALRLDVDFLKSEIAKLVDVYPDLADDAVLRADMIEAETGIENTVSKLVRARMQARALATAGKEIRDDQIERIRRFERQEKAYSDLIKSVLNAANMPKLILPEATVSITEPRVVVEITDLEALPQGFVRIERVARKTEILLALKAGEQVPGAALGFGESGITIRTK